MEAEPLAAPTPLVGHAAVDMVPALVVLTLERQLADKVCAVFERHGRDGRPSSRPRDLPKSP